MRSTASTPLEIQDQIVDQILDIQTNSGPVLDQDIAAETGLDLPTLRVHLELLACEDRLELIRGDTEYHACILDRQRPIRPPMPSNQVDPHPALATRHPAALSSHALLLQRWQRIGRVFEAIQKAFCRIADWAPLTLAIVGAILGWYFAGPATRNETILCLVVFGLLIGLIVRDELDRWAEIPDRKLRALIRLFRK